MSSRLSIACAVGVMLFALAYLAPSTVGRGLEMDEGAVVAYSARVLDGAVPHRDFLTFYGPGNLWVVAGAFAAFGESVGSERAVGMLYRLLIVFALLLLGWRLAGMAGGVLAALVATARLGGELIWAYATYGALAFGLLGIALTAWAVTAVDGRRQRRGLAVGGLVAGIAVLFRFDFALAAVLGTLPLLTRVPRRARWWSVAGFLGSVSIFVVHLAIVGPDRISRLTSDLVASGPGRTLPMPRPWVYPGSLLAMPALVSVAFVVGGAVLWRRRREEPVPQVLVAVGLFALGVLPWTLSRPDVFHINPAAVAPLSLLPAAAFFAISILVAGWRVRIGLGLAVAFVTVLAAVMHGDFTFDRAREVRGVPSGYRGFEDDDSRPATRAVIARLHELSRPGESIFVGPQDLRRTNYGPTYMYFLFRDLRPASYYMEMNPGTANREGSGLADELRRADWLILTSEWDDWNEPNESSDLGPSEPNDVVARDFCLRLERGQYRLYERCEGAA